VTAGLVNAHTHLYSGLAPFGIPAPEPPPQTFVQILERLWWRLDRALDEPTLHASARYYVAEALLHGTTALVDHHESPSCIEGSLDVLADACESLGMRALLTFGATERNGGRDEARRGLAECRRFILANRRPLVRGAVGLHASFTVSDDTIREAATLCRDLGAVLHVHVAEDAADVVDAQARGYRGPIERLEALGALVPGSILAHGVHLADDRVRRVRNLGCWIVQNPRSNRGNRVGYGRCLRASDRVAIGTDGYPSDMIDEGLALQEVGHAHGDADDVLDARLLAGDALVREVLDPGWPVTTPAVASARDVLSARRRSALAHHDVQERHVLCDGRLLTADIDAIRREAREAADRLWQRMREVTP
jgi:cytosine/adenosine deaminase-related metal-dependent hydrolase